MAIEIKSICPYGNPLTGCHYDGDLKPKHREVGKLTGDGYCNAYGDEAKEECLQGPEINTNTSQG